MNWFDVVKARIAIAEGHSTRPRRAIDAAKAIDAPTNVLTVTVPALEAWLELERGDLASAIRLVDPAHRWAVDADVPLHHGVLEAIVVLGWCHLGAGELALAAEVAALATEYAESLGFPWDVVRAGVLGAEVQRLGTGAERRSRSSDPSGRASTARPPT